LMAVVEKMGLNGSDWAYIGDTNVDKTTADSAGAEFFVVPWGGGKDVNVQPHQRLARIADLMEYRAQ